MGRGACEVHGVTRSWTQLNTHTYKVPYLSLILLILLSLDSLLLFFFFLSALKNLFIESQTSSVRQ